MAEFAKHYVRGLGMSARNNALAYGYSITATASFGVLAQTDRPANTARIFLFVAGSGAAFAAINAVVTRGFRARVQTEPPVVLALATSLSVLSMSAGVGVTVLLALLKGWAPWLLAGALSSWAYLLVAALETATSRVLHVSVGETDPEER